MGKRKQAKKAEPNPRQPIERLGESTIDTLNIHICQRDPEPTGSISDSSISNQNTLFIHSFPKDEEGRSSQVMVMPKPRTKKMIATKVNKQIKKINNDPQKNLMKNFVSWISDSREEFMTLTQIRTIKTRKQMDHKFTKFKQRLQKMIGDQKRKGKFSNEHLRSLITYTKFSPTFYLTKFLHSMFRKFLDVYPKIVKNKIKAKLMKQETKNDNLSVISKFRLSLQNQFHDISNE